MVWRWCCIQCITFYSLISHIDHWCYPSCGWHLGQSELGELFFPLKWEGHQCPLCAHRYWHCHHNFGHFRLFCYLPGFCMDAKTGEFLFFLELILGFWKVLHTSFLGTGHSLLRFFLLIMKTYQVTVQLPIPTFVVFSLPCSIKTCWADWADLFFFPFDSLCGCDVSCLCWLGLSFYPAVCNVSDSHFFGWTGRCHRRVCFQTWGKLEFGR